MQNSKTGGSYWPSSQNLSCYQFLAFVDRYIDNVASCRGLQCFLSNIPHGKYTLLFGNSNLLPLLYIVDQTLVLVDSIHQEGVKDF